MKEPKPLTRCYSYIRIITLRRLHRPGRSTPSRHCPLTKAVDMESCPARVAALLIICLPACDSASPRRPVSGTVSIDGVEVSVGSISFLPDAGHRGPAASTAIVAGKYRFDSENGPTPGPHRVIVGVEQTPATSESGEQAPSPSSPESSSVAKLGPTAPTSSSTPSSQEKNEAENKTQWTSRATVLAADSPATIDFAFPKSDSANALSADSSP